ncbi:MAG: restriction endonuclease subunit S, partial [Desulfobaccales bacterium]
MNEDSFEPRSRRQFSAKWRPYPTYKDSGVEWLGEIPAHWEVMKFKRLGSFQAGTGFPDEEQGITDEELPFYKVSDTNLQGNELFMLIHNNSITKDTAKKLRAFIFPPETIIFAKVGAALLLNKRRILTYESCIDNNMMGFTRKNCNLKWAYYWMCCLDLARLANPGAVPSINEGQMREVPVPVPPFAEQRGIANFLEGETGKIDALIAKKERQIELLQEKRTALISRAVTRGLDPNIPLKDSGIDWLGHIPAHWEVKRLKNVTQINPEVLPETADPDYVLQYIDPKLSDSSWTVKTSILFM